MYNANNGLLLYYMGINLPNKYDNVIQLRINTAWTALNANIMTPSVAFFASLEWIKFGKKDMYHTCILACKCLTKLSSSYISEMLNRSNNTNHCLRSTTNQYPNANSKTDKHVAQQDVDRFCTWEFEQLTVFCKTSKQLNRI